MVEAKLVGGTAQDQAVILQVFTDYLVANADYDWDRLQTIWSAAPEGTFFNLNGHTYKGREHWTALWKYYKQRVNNGIWEPYDLGGVVSDELAVLWCERKTRYVWTGQEPPDPGRLPERAYISRSTMTFRKEGGEWRVVHVHFSPASEDPRPGGV